MCSTYFAEGLPYSIVHQVATQFFTAMQVSLESIGLVSLYGLAWNLKFLWSPLVDLLGTPRRWLVATQLLLGLTIGVIAYAARDGNLQTVARLLVVVAVMAATQDIAIDGYYIRGLRSKQQAAFVGLRVAAYRAALMVGNGALVWVAGKVSWWACFTSAALLMTVSGFLHQWLLPSIQRDPAATKVRSAGTSQFLNAFVSFFRQPGACHAVVFILVYRLGDAMLFAMSTPLLRDLQVDTATRGIVSGVGTAVGIVGAIVTGALIARRGLGPTLLPIAIVQAAALPIYVLLAALRPPLPYVILAALTEQLAAGVGTAGLSVFLMRLCGAGPHKASHFAIATALMSLAATVSGSASGYLAKALGYTGFFALASVAAIPSLLMARIVRDGLVTPAKAS